MKIAYLISVYKDAKQFGRMINALQGAETHFFVHVDAKVEQRSFEDAVPEAARKHVHFTPKRYWIQWGGFNQVRYQKEMLSAALSSGISFDRFFILTGQDYPLWSNSEIEKELTDNPAKEYIMGLDVSSLIKLNGGGKLRDKLILYHFFRDMKYVPYKIKKIFSGGSRIIMKILPIRKKPYVIARGRQMDVYQASGYMCITSALAKYVLKEMNENKELMHYFQYSFAPDELAIQTIIFNSPFKDHCMLYGYQRYDGLKSLSAITYFNYGKSIQIFTAADYDEIKGSGKMFARKMATGVSDELMQRLDREHGIN